MDVPPSAAVVAVEVADAGAPVVIEDAPPLGNADDDAGPVTFPVVGVPVDAAPAKPPPAVDDEVDDGCCCGRKACGGMGGGLICVSTTGGRAA